MYEKVLECPICSHQGFSNHIICTDHLVSDEAFAIVKCDNCGLKVTSPRPNAENIGKYYESEDYASHQQSSRSLMDVAYKTVRGFALNKKLKLVNSLATEPGKLLDVGCGTGLFLNTCEKGKWKTAGVEVNNNARESASKIVRGHIYESLDNLELKKTFDVITAWHVIEHLHDLRGSLKMMRKLLKKDGSVVIAVPNSDSWDADNYKEFWAAYDVPRHLYHFNQLNIKELANELKFKVKQVLPMKLDSFYVSLLSEKYKYGSTNYLRAINNGLKSNRWARKNQNNYSSLIYILSKK
ncbi:MAG: class I SAM-dependent methyltransferase [Cyclobacteriaceae bacterium]